MRGKCGSFKPNLEVGQNISSLPAKKEAKPKKKSK